MGHFKHTDFFKSEECRTAYLSEMEFTEMARVLKMVAGELHQDTDAAITELARGGLSAALDVLAQSCDGSVSDAYYRNRDAWRASQIDIGRTH